MSLKLGSITTIVVSSPSIAKLVLQKHDQVFSSRTIPNSMQMLGQHEVSMVWLPASAQWRNLRKICREHIFSSQRLDAGQGLRQKKVQELLDYVKQSCSIGKAVDIGKFAFTTSMNSLSNTFFSSDMASHNSNSSQEFKDLVSAIMEQAGKPNLADYFPALKLVDPQGIQRKLTTYAEKMFAIFDGIIDQRLQSRASLETNSDVIEVLLNLSRENDTQLLYSDIKDLFAAGTDTTSSNVEWAMAELLHKPEKLAKARAELEEVIGKDGIVQESDISRLPSLQAVVKETLRLHPAVPFLVPHKAEADVEIGGFIVPKNAQVLVNLWAIGRDSSVWPEPNSCVPERFLDIEIDIRGQDFELISFGAGRRMCPGLPLAHRMVHFVLASLLHAFDWMPGGGIKPEDIDMSDKLGITLPKAMPLKAVPIEV